MLALLVTLAAACCAAGTPGPIKPGQQLAVCFPLQLGFFDGRQAWYTFFGSNDIDWVRGLTVIEPLPNQFYFEESGYTLYPKLASALAGGASPVYFVTNFQQGPVFTAMPGQIDYSGLWQVNLITWKPGVTPRPINDAGNLPDPSEADIVPIDVIVNLPILAVGQLGGPWLPAPLGTYRIPQGLGYVQDGPQKLIFLPAWPAFAQDQVTKRITTVFLVITDTADASLSAHLSANYAPALADLDDANAQTVWYFMKGQKPPVPPNQNLVLEHTVTVAFDTVAWYGYNGNSDFSPVMNMQPLVRGTIPVYVTVNNPILLQRLLTSGGLLPMGGPIKMNTFLTRALLL